MDKTNNEISRSFLDLLDIMVSLRNPDSGCEWDRSQDSHTLKKYCLEEAYEVVDAIENNNTEGLCEELGDLLFSIVNLSRHLDIDANEAINQANHKFVKRFRLMEEQIAKDQKELANLILTKKLSGLRD